MGNSKFIHGKGLTEGVTPTASSTKKSSSYPSISPDTTGTATINVSGKYEAPESDVYEVIVTEDSATDADSKATDPEFQGSGDRGEDALSLFVSSSVTPTGVYELECTDPGQPDSVAATSPIFESQGVRFIANLSFTEAFSGAISVAGEVGNAIRIAVYAVRPDFDGSDLNVTPAIQYPRPSSDYDLQIQHPIGISAIQDNRSVVDFSDVALFNTIDGEDISIPYIDVDGNIEGVGRLGTATSSGAYTPQDITPRFLLGMVPPDENVTAEELFRKAYTKTIFSQYKKGGENGMPLYGIKAPTRVTGSNQSLSELPAGHIPYPVTGGYVIHVYLRDSAAPTTADHTVDFFYSSFPLFDDAGNKYWFPITTWGEFAYALDMHQKFGYYHAVQEEPITDVSPYNYCQFPLIRLDTTSPVLPRRESFSAWENTEIGLRSGGSIDFPRFSGSKLQSLSGLSILNRDALRDESITIEVVEIDSDGIPQIDVTAPASFSAIGGSGAAQLVIARLIPNQTIQDALEQDGSSFGLDFYVPNYNSGTIVSTGEQVDTSEDIATFTIALKNDTAANPRPLKLCVHHLFVGPGAVKETTVTAIFTRFSPAECDDCNDYIPDVYNDDCLNTAFGTGGGASLDSSISNIYVNISGSQWTPLPITGVSSKIPFVYERRLWEDQTEIDTHLSLFDAAIAKYEDLLFQYKIIDRSGIDPAFRKSPDAKDYTLLLGGDEVLGEDIIPTNSIDPFVGAMTSGCTVVTRDAEDGKSYSSWGMRVDYGVNTKLHFTDSTISQAVRNQAANVGDRSQYIPADSPFRDIDYGNDLFQFPSHFDSSADSDAVWGGSSLPAPLSEAARGEQYNQEWADPGFDFYMPLLQGRNRDIDWYLYYFRNLFLENLSGTSGASPYSKVEIMQETDILIRDWIEYNQDPGGYIERVYSSHSDYLSVFKSIYRLPGLTDMETPFLSASGDTDSGKWLVKITYRFQQDGSVQDWVSPGPGFQPGWPVGPRIVPARDVQSVAYVTFDISLTEAEVIERVQNEWNQSLTDTVEDTTWSIGGLTYTWRRTPATVNIVYTLLSYTVNRVQDLNFGPSDKLKSRVGQGLADILGVPTVEPNQWDIVHMGGLMVRNIVSRPSDGVGIHSLFEGPPGTFDAPNVSNFGYSGQRGFSGHRAMDQIFWLRLLKVVEKVGFHYDIDYQLNTEPTDRNKTNRVGCAVAGVCEYLNLDIDFWGVNVTDTDGFESYPSGYTNRTYYDLLRQRFSFLLATSCPELLIYNDVVTMTFIPRGLNDQNTDNYSVGDKATIRSSAGVRFPLLKGVSDKDTATWKFKAPDDSDLRDKNVKILNRAGTTIVTPSSDFLGLFETTLIVNTRYLEGDKFIWSLAGGKFIVRKSDGTTIGPLVLTPNLQEFFTITNLASLHGDWSVTIGTDTVTEDSSDGLALSQLAIGQTVSVDGEVFTVDEVTDDDTFVLSGNHTAGASGATVLTDYDHAIKFSFDFNSRAPFSKGDSWRINLVQNHAASSITHWDFDQKWTAEGNTDEWVEYNFGSGNGKAINVAALVGHNLTPGATVTLEAKDTADSWGSPPFTQSLTVESPEFSGYPSNPVIYYTDTLTTAYEQWRVKITDATLTEISLGRFLLGNSTLGLSTLVYDHDIYLDGFNEFNPFDGKDASIFKGWEESINVSYDLLTKASFAILWNVLYESKLANNQPFIWIPNINSTKGARVCSFSSNRLSYNRRDAEFLISEGWYSGIKFPLKVKNV